MGNCFPFLKLSRNKYQENLETPSQKLENIQLNSEDFISGLSTCGSTWVISQETLISLYKDFVLTTFWNSQDRIRSLQTKDNFVYAGCKSIEMFETTGKEVCKFTGHERPVNSFDVLGKFLVSGSGDWSVRLWDIERNVEVCKEVINWNVVTCLKWVDHNVVVQASEDLRIRLWDVRVGKINESCSINVGDNFATCLDVKDFDLVSGHRGFSGNGCDVKKWDLRKPGCLFTCKAHDMPVEAVKFSDVGIFSCGKDGKIVKYDQSGKILQSYIHPTAKPFVSMDTYKEGLLTASIEPRIMYFTLNPLQQSF